MKTLYIISHGIGKLPQKTMLQLERKDKIPRVSLLEEALSAELLDERYLLEKPPFFRRWLYRYLPVGVSQIVEAIFIQHKYDVVFSQSEKVGLPLALLKKYLRLKTPHVVIISRITSLDSGKTNQKRWFVRKTRNIISRYLIWSSVQRKIAVDQLGVPASKMILLKRGTDQKFWRPLQSGTDMICSVGMEARDYPTLVEALRPVDIPCHIATGSTRGEFFSTVERLYKIDNMPETITVGKKKHADLRKLYARCRFVVVSLLPTDSDNGLTAILEAMAMGKPVICSRVEGQVDVIRDGVTGVFVKQGDPAALRDAITELWNDRERAEMMGREARKYIEKYHSVEQFVEAIKSEVAEVIAENKTEKSYNFSKGFLIK